MTREAIAVVIFVLLIGVIVGWIAGWVARGEENRRWAESFRRRVDRAEALARDAVAELEVAHADLQRLDRAWVPTPAVSEIHVHVQATPALGYHDLSGAPAVALPRVIEAGPS